ncbi:MAG: MarR family winged helix-turn-helix transcriptional regulator [Candidatus Sericytochromatia bacterium]
MKKNTDKFVLKKMMGFYVNRTAFLMSEGIANKFNNNGSDITAQDFGILNLLYKNNGQTSSFIAKEMLRDKTTITRRIDLLVKKGFLFREVDKEDKRVIRIYLTDKAKEKQSDLISNILDFHNDVLSGVSEEDLEVTIKTLEKIISNIKGS